MFNLQKQEKINKTVLGFNVTACPDQMFLVGQHVLDGGLQEFIYIVGLLVISFSMIPQTQSIVQGFKSVELGSNMIVNLLSHPLLGAMEQVSESKVLLEQRWPPTTTGFHAYSCIDSVGKKLGGMACLFADHLRMIKDDMILGRISVKSAQNYLSFCLFT